MQHAASPDPRAQQEARDWIARGTEDIQVAELTLRASPALLGTSVFHSQQAAEKVLKAFLAAHQVRFRLVHDLVELHGQCQGLDEEFAVFAAAAHPLTPYATQFRYPGGLVGPSRADAEEAFQLAQKLFGFVRTRLGQ